jgi:hypothetical protein
LKRQCSGDHAGVLISAIIDPVYLGPVYGLVWKLSLVRLFWLRCRSSTSVVHSIGMQIFHNYIRPHEALEGKSPCEVAGIVPIRFVTLQLFSAYVSLTVDVHVSRFPIRRQSSV